MKIAVVNIDVSILPELFFNIEEAVAYAESAIEPIYGKISWSTKFNYDNLPDINESWFGYVTTKNKCGYYWTRSECNIHVLECK